MSSVSFIHSVKSRQKHRKLLGVGEDADGKIPRSKISQLLGNPVSTSVIFDDDDYPVGLIAFQWITCSFFFLVSMAGLLSPDGVFAALAAVVYPSSNVISTSYDRSVEHLHSMIARSGDVEDLNQALRNLDSLMETMRSQATLLFCVGCFVIFIYLFAIVVKYRNNKVAVQSGILLVATYFIFEIIACVTFFNSELADHMTFHVTATWWRASIVLLAAHYIIKMTSSSFPSSSASSAGVGAGVGTPLSSPLVASSSSHSPFRSNSLSETFKRD